MLSNSIGKNKLILLIVFMILALIMSGCSSVQDTEYDGNKNNSSEETTEFENGKYTGELKDGKPHGQGLLVLSDGSYYMGEWVDGYREGTGIWANMDCEVYSGEWSDDNKHGAGSWTTLGWESYHGEWKNGKMHGAGVYIELDKSGQLGEWEEGEIAQRGRNFLNSSGGFMGSDHSGMWYEYDAGRY